jgi:DNA topoisomerase-1
MSTKSYNKPKTTLVIVESPAKCAKIESFLGQNYKCVASFGHLRKLESLDDIDRNFNIKYKNDEKKEKQIDKLRREISQATEVILATDDDREGEAIAWHVCSLFGLPVETTKRILFREITESAIQNAVMNPGIIDMNKVNSQQTRQVLDLMVGFKVSPILWKYISSNGLSAGRCQTPALKIIYDNHVEITNNPGTILYNTTGYFSGGIPFELNKEYESESAMCEFLEKTCEYSHVFTRTEPKKVFKAQPQPLTTSRIQQIASNELHISPKETMSICQTLYEEGYITYMRTDSKKYSAEFVENVKTYIMQNYNDKRYIYSEIDFLKNSIMRENSDEYSNPPPAKRGTKGSSREKDVKPQEAHEAIRPTYLEMREITDNDKIKSREKRVYKLIWETSLESCMSPAEYYSITANIDAPMGSKYAHTCEILDFLGWKIVANANDKKMLKHEKENKTYHHLNKIKQGITLQYNKITSCLVLKNLKQHYTEAKLVQILEEKGIGRPSTFSMIIDKIQDKAYVKKENIPGKSMVCKDFELEDDTISEIETTREFGNEKNKLVIQQMGVVVMEFLYKYFNELFNYDYTSEMEVILDQISKGEKAWTECCNTCLEQIDGLVHKLKNTEIEHHTKESTTGTRKETSVKYEIPIDSTHSYIIGKYGPVIKCTIDPKKTMFLPVKKDIDISVLENGGYKLQDVVDTSAWTVSAKSGICGINTNVLGTYEDQDLIVKKGKFGLYVEWGTNSKSLKVFGNRPIENITYNDVVKVLEETSPNASSNTVRNLTETISIRRGKYGDYIFYKNEKMFKPEFFKLNGFPDDYKSCDKRTLLSWINDTHHIY